MTKHVHHDLIVQWAKDTTQVVEIYDGKWRVISRPSWDEYHKYRIRHKHQDLIDQKAARPELIVEARIPGGTWRVLTHPSFDSPNGEYRLVDPEKKKVEMWQWIIKNEEGTRPYNTSYFYKSEKDVSTSIGEHNKIIQRADWTRIEVEE